VRSAQFELLLPSRQHPATSSAAELQNKANGLRLAGGQSGGSGQPVDSRR
jgi:hypothetical protein